MSMKQLGFLKCCQLVLKANKMSREQLEALQQQRLREIIAHARAHSPYYRELYKDLGDNPDFQSLPITTKQGLMQNFDRWLTDPSITLDKVRTFMANDDNIGREFEGKGILNYTSGSTGTQCVVLYDHTTSNITYALNYFRSFAHSPDFLKAIFKGAKYTAIVDDGFYVEYTEFRSQVLSSPYNKHRTQFIDVAESTADIVRKLNTFQPNFIGAYPSVMELLLPEIQAGRLRIKPNIVVIGGENSSPKLRDELRDALKCSVFNTYGATEGGMMAFECSEGNSHINIDWVVLEAVDEEYRPVPPGVRSHKILITNLSNSLQPFIRYEVTDRVIMGGDRCKCGSPLPYLIVEGRTDDILEFEGKNGPVKIIPMNLVPEAKYEGLLRYQLVQKDPYTLEMRLDCVDAASRDYAFQEARKMILHHLQINGVSNVTVYLADIKPQLVTKSGKFKSVFKERKLAEPVITDEND